MALVQAVQRVLQACVVGINRSSGFTLIKEDLSEKNNYPSKSEEYMANQVFYRFFSDNSKLSCILIRGRVFTLIFALMEDI